MNVCLDEQGRRQRGVVNSVQRSSSSRLGSRFEVFDLRAQLLHEMIRQRDLLVVNLRAAHLFWRYPMSKLVDSFMNKADSMMKSRLSQQLGREPCLTMHVVSRT